MSTPQLRRQDRQLAEAEARELIARAYCGRLATVGADGAPYLVPLLHVFAGGEGVRLWSLRMRHGARLP